MKPRTADLALAGIFLVLGQLEVWIWWTPAEQGPKGLAALFLAAMVLVLAWRRAAALPVQLVMSALLAAWSLATPPTGSLVPWLAMIVAAYSVAATTLPTAVAGLAANWAAWVLFVALTTGDVADYSFILGFILAGWVAGTAVRAREIRAARAEAQAREADDRARTAIVDERARISRELHDVVSHSVSVMVVQAGAAEMVLTTDPHLAREPLLQIQETGREALVELKRLLGLLHGSDDELALAPAPSLTQLNVLLTQIRQAGMPVSLEVTGEPRALPPGVDLSAYRIIQEALTNALRYAGPAQARVSVDYGEDWVSLEIVDDGQGEADVRSPGTGHGLLGLRARVSVHGGELAAGPRPEGGFALQARLPL